MNAREDGKRAPVVALVRASGGLKPFAALPLLEFLDREKIEVDLLVGASGGGIVAAMRACGHSCEEIRRQITRVSRRQVFRLDWPSMLGVLNLPGGRFTRTSGFFKPGPLRQMFRKYFGDRRMEDLPRKLILQATDFDNGQGVVLSEGNLADAVYASMAILPFLPPIRMGGRWLFDGYFSAPVPILPAVSHPADVIIVLEVLEEFKGPETGFMELMMHTNKITSQAIMRSQAALSVILHHHEIVFVKVRFDQYLRMWDFDQLPCIFEAGAAATAKYGEEILRAIRGFTPVETPPAGSMA